MCIRDRIKGIYMNLDALDEPVGVHRAQAMWYAYIYALQHDLAEISVQLTYCNLDTIELTKTAFLGNLKYFRETFSFAELAEWFTRLTDEYKKWADFQFAWQNLRQASIKKLEFPYAYRKGQKELASDVYRTIARRKNLFIQAPTGVGKTISTVFPAVKAVGEGLGDKIFYLTAKTITGTVAKEAFELLRTRGYQAKIIQLTAKEKPVSYTHLDVYKRQVIRCRSSRLMPPMCAITSSSAWSGIKMCLAQQNSDGEESHDGLTGLLYTSPPAYNIGK